MDDFRPAVIAKFQQLQDAQRAVHELARQFEEMVGVRVNTQMDLTTINLDDLIRFCIRPGCGRLYIITSRRKRKYCSLNCAHYASVLRSRERKKGLPA